MIPMPSHPSMPPVSAEAAGVLPSGIGEVFAYGFDRPGLIPLWVGEGDRPTPDFIGEAAGRALRDGATFYTRQLGIPALREALAEYVARLYGGAADPGGFFVTVGGMHAFQIAVRIAAEPGDEIVIPTPAWPNFFGAIAAQGACTVAVPMQFDAAAGWSLDIARIAAAVTPRTRAIVLNSPSNPTGWTATPEDYAAVLAIARNHDLWIIADEIYGRFSFDPAHAELGRAPSIRDVWEAEDRDRVLFVQTFSKNWAMTGWRVGWLEGPPALGRIVDGLILYATSGVATFLQHAAATAIRDGEDLVRRQVAQAREGRRILTEGLGGLPGVDLPPPPGAFYAFPKVNHEPDSRALALRLVDEANVGVAPGTAFGPGGEGFLRLCFARSADDLHEAVRRLSPALSTPAGR
ncbi:pyridoxal phosphate-dependent aminotransferase [Methylobacterium oryzihabitans]|uniref:8-amino-7-oxononanoate synthase n=1 Tax=Methylobacterium oryzihabitans TaxID=2499852 RepID=A0A437PHW0_9HYPH|nr:pyridoxal phosphate-dependent aminotransferase [Methylobacterium oryzihabitans]RVU21872.1 pyridoxal phosphate-dependent aminotransferase [Methylobacterium oryzihabitans]